MHNNYVLSYFQNWKKNATHKKKRQKKKMIMQMEESSKAMEDECLGNQQKAKVKAEAVGPFTKGNITKCLTSSY